MDDILSAEYWGKGKSQRTVTYERWKYRHDGIYYPEGSKIRLMVPLDYISYRPKTQKKSSDDFETTLKWADELSYGRLRMHTSKM